MDEARVQLHRIINDREMKEATIHVFANKQALPDGMAARKGKTTDKVKSLEDCLSELSVADENVVRSALSADQDLSNFSALVKEELTEAHKVAVRECKQNAEKLTDLHNQIVACDQVFERLEKMLLRFQDDLGTISEDMKRLQDQSVSINQELENRQKVRGELRHLSMISSCRKL